jgi:hypothetical protein
MLADQQQAAEVELLSVVEAHTKELTTAQTELQHAKSALRTAQLTSAAAIEELSQLRSRASGKLSYCFSKLAFATMHCLFSYYTTHTAGLLRFGCIFAIVQYTCLSERSL